MFTLDGERISALLAVEGQAKEGHAEGFSNQLQFAQEHAFIASRHQPGEPLAGIGLGLCGLG